MTENKQLKTITTPNERLVQLEAELAEAQYHLRETERTLAEEQAAVNKFRMYCRLTIGHWVDTLIELRGEKQALITKKRLLQQDLGIPDEASPSEESIEPDNDTPSVDTVDSLAGAILEELIDAEAQREAEKSLYRDLARRFHPDLATNHVEKAYRTSIMAAVNAAYQQRNLQMLRDLAGEIDPKLIAELEQIDSKRVRKLRERIIRCQRYERKVALQLEASRKENTAKLWRKANDLDVEGDADWWAEIQLALEDDVKRIREETAALARQVEALQQLAAALEEDAVEGG